MGIEVEIANPQQPHVATVLLLDTSSSMEGFKIDQLNEGLIFFKEDVMNDELARKRVDLAVITFGQEVSVLKDFGPIDELNPPKLVANGLTPMGETILKAINMVENRKNEYKAKGTDYYRPWIFMITDGEPTDMHSGDFMWNEVIRKIHEGEAQKKFAFFAVGVEPANMDILKEIAPPNRIPLKLNQKKFKEMFEWLSKSQAKVSSSNPGDQLALNNTNGWTTI